MAISEKVREALGEHEDVLCAFESGDRRVSIDDVKRTRAALVAAIEAEVEAAWERGRNGDGVEP